MLNRIWIFGRGRTTVLRKHVNRCLKDFCSPLGAKTVLNLGAKPNHIDKEGRVYEDYFPGADFRTLDLAPHDDPRHIHGDLMDLPADAGTYDLVIANSVIEHIDRPWVAAPNITGLVRPGGHLFIAMPWFYPVHEGPYFGDHWRATPSGMRFLFGDMKEIRHDFSPSSIIAVWDRKKYWNKTNSTSAGFCMLMRRE
ncbi:MAG: methyltransferase domain-containing protein [Mesorhizobium sp.]|nr:MAG: methyltransferase domain-containing protein [Mesorhizobium sp.]RWO07292.1 MAG: methyltransferase domain-containing protein [Mesorhizobium sp.]RWO16111.1 MAG: methyltransferase domain-containing protein [Mesorhizobium sp.]RWP15394.1 MAG: methyltransferase domain-containing protein [Mesorhizobium sp.]RWP22273.1 MAG: methyltransferase domain-containing protein [Mesorhizobium sp.]